MDNYYKEKYDDLLYEYERLLDRCRELERENSELNVVINSLEYKIRTELEPRIQREKRAYDNWVSNPER